MAAVTKCYILVMSQSYISNTHRFHCPEELHIIPEDPVDGEWVEVSEGTLGAQTLEEFASTHKPVYAGATPVFDSWGDRDTGVGAVQSVALAYNGSNTPTVTLSGGVPDSGISVAVSGGILCNVVEGSLDGSGGIVLTIKNVSATSGNLTVRPRGHSDFGDFAHTIEFENWSP